jgi:hypothetical protein
MPNPTIITALNVLRHSHLVTNPEVYTYETNLGVSGRTLTKTEQAAYDSSIEFLTRVLRGEIDAKTEAEISADREVILKIQQLEHDMKVERLKAAVEIRKARILKKKEEG